jgi:hypothetical protein
VKRTFNVKGAIHLLYLRAVTFSGIFAMFLGLLIRVGDVHIAGDTQLPNSVAWVTIVAGLIAVIGSFIKEGTPVVKYVSQKLKGKDTEPTMQDRVKQEEDRMFVKR